MTVQGTRKGEWDHKFKCAWHKCFFRSKDLNLQSCGGSQEGSPIAQGHCLAQVQRWSPALILAWYNLSDAQLRTRFSSSNSSCRKPVPTPPPPLLPCASADTHPMLQLSDQGAKSAKSLILKRGIWFQVVVLPELVPSAVRQAPGQGQDHSSGVRTTALTQAPVELRGEVLNNNNNKNIKKLILPCRAADHSFKCLWPTFISLSTHTRKTNQKCCNPVWEEALSQTHET